MIKAAGYQANLPLLYMLEVRIALCWKTAQLRGITCHMGSHNVTWHPT